MSSSGVLLNGSTQIATTSSLSIYKYEPFSYIYEGEGGQSLVFVSATTSIRALVTQVDSTIQFQSLSGYTGVSSTAEALVFRTSPGNVTYTVNVTIGAGRFVVPLETNPSYSLYVNESISQTYGSTIEFQAPGTLSITVPTSVPALPPGLSFSSGGPTSSQTWYLSGTPLIGSPATSYTIYGRGSTNTSLVISKVITISIGTERVSITAVPSSNVSLTVGTPITDVRLTTRYPNSFSGNLRYEWSFLPDGLRFVDSGSNTVTSPFSPSDASSTMILTGTPTGTAAQTFRALGSSNVITTIGATRLTSPSINSTQPLSLTFGQTVLFDPITVPTLYRNDPIDASSIVFTARTYFPSGTGIASIAATSLPVGLSLFHTPGDSNAYLTGTPTVVSSANYSIVATNSNGIATTLSTPITVQNDIITITGPTDVCYNFVISRPIASSLTGYYPSNIAYSATSSTGHPLNLSITNLSNVGISVDVSGSTLTLGGIPDTVRGFTTSVFTASNSLTGAFASCNLNYAILTDDITITNPTTKQTFFQNQEITPIQFAATTLSERPVVGWSSPNLPEGLFLSGTGLLTGSPTNASSGDQTFNVNASTGYVSEQNAFTYNTIGDDILITTTTGGNVTVSEQFSNSPLDVVAYSGSSNVVLTVGDIKPIQSSPITLSITSNLLSGDFGTAGCIVRRYSVAFDASLGNQGTSQRFLIDINNANTQRHFMMDICTTRNLNIPPPGSITWPEGRATLYRSDVVTYSPPAFGSSGDVNPPANSFTQTFSSGNVTYGSWADVAFSSNTGVIVTGSSMYRTSDTGSTWSLIPTSDISSYSNIVGGYFSDGTVYTVPGPILTSIASDRASNWVSIGFGYNSNNPSDTDKVIVRTSSNNGQTWIDDSNVTGIPTVAKTTTPSISNRLYYNNGRYFGAIQGRPVRADVSTPTAWTNLELSGLPSGIAFFAFNGDVGLAGGVNDVIYRTTDNGTTWSNSVSGIISTSVVQEVANNGNYWCGVTTDPSGGSVYVSSNGLTFSRFFSKGGEQYSNVEFDGAVFNTFKTNTLIAGIRAYYNDSFAQDTSMSERLILFNLSSLKRVFTECIDNGPVTATFSAPTSNNPVRFISPTSNDYTFLQYTGANIQFQATATTPGFIYYYATGLPQGTRRVLDPSGVYVDVSGIVTRYDSSYRPTTIYARSPGNSNAVAAFTITTRVLSPFVLKQQNAASGYTAFLRDYVNVNAAQSARDSVALPVQERPLGEFMSPGVNDVVTQTVDPKCFSTSNCT